MTYVDQDAKSFGDALFMLAEELNQTEEIKDDLQSLCKIMNSNPEYLKLLETPALSREERLDLVDKAFKSLNKNLVNLVKILVERRLLYLLNKINDAYIYAYDISRRIERVDAISAIQLSSAKIEKLQNKLASITGKTIIINNTVDPSILGGMKIRYSGTQIDGSLKTKLENFEQALKDIVI